MRLRLAASAAWLLRKKLPDCGVVDADEMKRVANRDTRHLVAVDNDIEIAVSHRDAVDLNAISHDIIQTSIIAWWAVDADDPLATKEAITSIIELAKKISPAAPPEMMVINGPQDAETMEPR